jgi:3-methyladenine DNA glycosylase/8-oxoguanine DNA glycosylase
MTIWTTEFPLIGPGGEPVDLWRTLNSHGVAALPPARLDEASRTLAVTLALPGFGPRTVTIGQGRDGHVGISSTGVVPSNDEASAILNGVKHILRFDQDLSPFYALAADDPDLGWIASGAGRMTRCATVFEDVVKTICTTNCNWGATVKMVSALVEHLGEPVAGAPETGPWGRTFPTPAALAAADEAFYRDVVRAGYRGRYLQALARSVVAGEVDLESLGTVSSEELPDDDLAKRLLALPGVGPYAAAHIMMMIGRCSRPILDSWTRPTYARIVGRETVPDAEILARFQPYGAYAGLAFWLFVTRDWIAD